MSRPGLLPSAFSRVHTSHRTPHVSTWVAGLFVGIPAGIWDIGTFADLANIGTLFAFMVVAAGVIVLRRKQPERPRGFRMPGVPWLPALSILFCLILMLTAARLAGVGSGIHQYLRPGMHLLGPAHRVGRGPRPNRLSGYAIVVPPYFVKDLNSIDWYERWLEEALGPTPDRPWFGFDNPGYL